MMQISSRATTRWRQQVKSELASYLEVVGPWWDVQTAANNYRALHPLKQTTDSDFASNSVRNA